MLNQLLIRFQTWNARAFGPPMRSAVVAGGIAIVVSLFIPNYYKSEGKILPAEGRASSGSAAAAAAMAGLSVSGQDSPDAVYVDILNSRWAMEKLLESKYKFSETGWYFGSREIRELKLIDYLQAKNVDIGYKKLNKKVSLVRDIKTKLLTISVETTSPELSKFIVQDLIKLLNEFLVEKARTKGSIKAEFSSERLVEARSEMIKFENEFRIFLDKNRNYLSSPDPGVRLLGQRMDNEFKLKNQLVANLAIAKEQSLIEEKNDMPILNVLDSGNLPIEKSYPPRSLIVLSVAAIAFVIRCVIDNKIKLLL